MISASFLPDPATLSQLVAEEELRVRSLNSSQDVAIISIRIPLSQFDILRWLKSCSDCPRFYWSNRDRSFEYGGTGNALRRFHWKSTSLPEQLDELQQLLRDSGVGDEVRAFVGCKFDSEAGVDNVWREFPRQCIQLPELSVISRHGKSVALLSVLLEHDHDRDAHLSRIFELAKRLESSRDLSVCDYHLTDRRDFPDQTGWQQAVNTAVSAVKSHHVEKIVLARRTDYALDQTPDAIDLLFELSRTSENCYRILFAPTNHLTFLSLSPEQLYSCDGLRLSTEAVAGTIRRGVSEIEDLALENRLRNSAKDKAEQRIVQEGIAASLEPLCTEVEVSTAASVMKLAHVQHLKSEFRAILKPDTTLGDLYQALHPTAAVCGMPRTEAKRMLSELEGFDRGWYASGIGIVGPQDCEFTVGIRAAILRPGGLSLFTGAGIVHQSDHRAEWQELEDKLHSIVPAQIEAEI